MTVPPGFAWQNGEIVPWDQCVLHARSQGAFWGANVFEGLRGYWNEDDKQLYLFRVEEHLTRLGRSMRSLRMEIGYTAADITAAVIALIKANDWHQDVHACVVAYFDEGVNFDPLNHTEHTGVHITATPMPRSRGYSQGVAACISSWRRISDDSMPPRIKTGANYHNSRLAQHEAVRNGYETTLLLNQHGTVSESPGACVVMVRDGKLVTPPGTSGVLEGITVATVEQIAHTELGLQLERRAIDRTELYVADEIFLCGTMAEILPVTSVDRLPIGTGTPGVLTGKLQQLYGNAVLGHPQWTTPVY
ncbi:branched-chain amino acid aminotransferase [Kibdelosporangium banguiense]|uniref:Branched-chain amino acid aminotransferase n=1 Tax=Kibdelosporangium banguiense TaxID=1365924 RepID=A0ABS4TPT8_9PSEU|nr:aminotransferase class IV [Kibdelosporangium banguiense]MBP2326417.1 branched-chain amino acid aminotransferase [Kibdelosporangium banguiense]